MQFKWDMLGFGTCRAAYLCCFVYLSSQSAAPHSLFAFWVSAAVAAMVVLACALKMHCMPVLFRPVVGPGVEGEENQIVYRRYPEALGGEFSNGCHTKLIVAAAALFTSGLLMMLLGDSVAHSGLSLAGTIFAGAGTGLLYVLWGIRLSRFSDNFIIMYVAIGFALAAVIMLVVNALPGSAGFAALVLGIVALFTLNDQWTPDLQAESAESEREAWLTVEYAAGCSHLADISSGMFARLSAMMAIVPFAYTLAVMTFIETSIFNRDLEGIIVALLAIAIIVLTRHIRFMGVLRATLPVIVAAYLFMRVLPADLNGILVVIAGSGIKLAELFVWIVIGSIEHSHFNHRWTIAAIGSLATFGGRAAAYLVGLALLSQPWYSHAIATYLLVVLLIVAVILMLPEGHRPVSEGEYATASKMQADQDMPERGLATAQEPSLSERCAALVSSKGLTKREAEVLNLLAQGRSQGIIAEKLGITEGTAHVHIMHVYQKLGVHGQQELITAVEEAFDEDSSHGSAKSHEIAQLDL